MILSAAVWECQPNNLLLPRVKVLFNSTPRLQMVSKRHTHLLESSVRQNGCSHLAGTHPYLRELSHSSVCHSWHTCLSQYEVQQGKQETVKYSRILHTNLSERPKGLWAGLRPIWLPLSIQGHCFLLSWDWCHWSTGPTSLKQSSAFLCPPYYMGTSCPSPVCDWVRESVTELQQRPKSNVCWHKYISVILVSTDTTSGHGQTSKPGKVIMQKLPRLCPAGSDVTGYTGFILTKFKLQQNSHR